MNCGKKLHLDHVEEVGDGLLLDDGQGVEVAAEGVGQLGFVQPRPACHLESESEKLGEK